MPALHKADKPEGTETWAWQAWISSRNFWRSVLTLLWALCSGIEVKHGQYGQSLDICNYFFFLCVDLVTLYYTACSGLCYADCSKWVCCWCYELGTNISNWVASVLERCVCVCFVLFFIIRNFSMAILRFGFCFLLTASFHHQHLFMFLTFQMASYTCSEIAANAVGLVRR